MSKAQEHPETHQGSFKGRILDVWWTLEERWAWKEQSRQRDQPPRDSAQQRSSAGGGEQWVWKPGKWRERKPGVFFPISA